MKPQPYPAGWNEERVRKLLRHYETQTEEEAVAEDEATLRRRDQTVLVVPKRLVPTITRIIAKAGQREQSSTRRPNQRAAPHRRPVTDAAEREKTRGAARGDRER
jgi:hypothetical protein